MAPFLVDLNHLLQIFFAAYVLVGGVHLMTASSLCEELIAALSVPQWVLIARWRLARRLRRASLLRLELLLVSEQCWLPILAWDHHLIASTASRGAILIAWAILVSASFIRARVIRVKLFKLDLLGPTRCLREVELVVDWLRGAHNLGRYLIGLTECWAVILAPDLLIQNVGGLV